MWKKERVHILSLQSGFVLAEIIIALVFVAMAIILVGSLATQVMNLSKSSTQSTTVIQYQNKTSSIMRKPGAWLDKMRADSSIGSVYSGCLPDSAAVASGFTCPAVDDTLLSDSGLAQLAGPTTSGGTTTYNLHPYSTAIVDSFDQPMAGTVSNPLYLNNDGTPCTNSSPQTNCPMTSVGYFLRADTNTNSNPGQVRFVVKVSQNQSAVNQRMGVNVMKAQYMSLDVGADWNQSSGNCPVGTVKFGYLTNGAPNCINPLASCPSGQVATGINNSGNPICQVLPSCPTGQSTVLNAATNALSCSGGTPCGSNQLFLGYTAGTGSPMCSSPNVSCPSGQIQTGLSTSASGQLSAQCASVPLCQSDQTLSYNGSSFSCANSTSATSCPSNQYVSGIDSSGKVICTARAPASTNLTCPHGSYVQGLNPDMSVICAPLPQPSLDCVSVTGTTAAANQNSVAMCPADHPIVTGGGIACNAGGSPQFQGVNSFQISGGWQAACAGNGQAVGVAFAMCCQLQ